MLAADAAAADLDLAGFCFGVLDGAAADAEAEADAAPYLWPSTVMIVSASTDDGGSSIFLTKLLFSLWRP
jgi:hypothetical protein